MRAGNQKTTSFYINKADIVLLAPGLMLYYIMMMFPMVAEFLFVKAFLFGVLLYIMLCSVVIHYKINLHIDIIFWTLFLSIISLFFVLKGFVAGGPGALKEAQVYVLWPIIYIVIIAGAANLRTLRWLERVMIFATITISLWGLNLILSGLGLIPEFGFMQYLNSVTFSTEDEVGIGLNEGFSGVLIPSINSLIFLLPYTIAALSCFKPTDKRNKPDRFFMWIALVLGISLALLCGRRALWVVIALTAIFIIILNYFQSKTNKEKYMILTIKRGIFIILIFIGTFIYFQQVTEINLAGLIEHLSEGFNFGAYADQSSSLRRDQFIALIAGWEDSPLLGAGLGTYAPGCIRSITRPWSYELYYIALLYQTGIIGLMVYGAGIFWIFFMGLKIIKEGGVLGQLMTSSLVGLMAILISSATNPYIDRFDGLWVIFFPLALVNYWLLNSPLNQEV
jgi:hypothetical protein